MRRGMERVVAWVRRVRGRRFITVAGSGVVGMRCRMGMALGWDMWGMAARGMDGWMRTIPDTALEMTQATIPATTRGMAIMGHTMLGRIRMGRV
jgi:hypothetical protein